MPRKGLINILILDFSYEWWNSGYGFNFNKSYFQNPDVKAKTNAAMHEKLCERFPWFKAYRPAPFGISVEPYGHRFIPAMFGCEIKFGDATAPWAENNILTREEIEATPMMTLEEYKQIDIVRETESQIKYARAKYGGCSGQQNKGGVMNTAIYLRGMDLFSDFYESPATVHKLFNLISNRMFLSYEHGKELDGRATDTGVGNCTVCMVSPDVYDEFVYPQDLAFMELAKSNGVRFSVHHDSDATKYVESYKRLEYLHHIDVGFDTDVALFRKNFPHVVLNIYLYTSFLLERTAGEIAADVKKLAALAGGPKNTWFTCADVDDNIPDEKVTALYEAAG